MKKMKKLAINPSNKKYYSEEYIKGWEDGAKAQYEATKDAVQVVRCKDCKHIKQAVGAIVVNDEKETMTFDYWCTATYPHVVVPNKNHFCSYGKRKGGDDE